MKTTNDHDVLLGVDVNTHNLLFSLQIKGVRLPRDGEGDAGRLKGFGYADFDDRASLIEALTMNDQTLKSRKIRVDLATHAGRGGMDGRRTGGRYDSRDPDDDRTMGDWRSGPAPESRRDDDRYDRRGDRDRGKLVLNSLLEQYTHDSWY